MALFDKFSAVTKAAVAQGKNLLEEGVQHLARSADSIALREAIMRFADDFLADKKLNRQKEKRSKEWRQFRTNFTSEADYTKLQDTSALEDAGKLLSLYGSCIDEVYNISELRRRSKQKPVDPEDLLQLAEAQIAHKSASLLFRVVLKARADQTGENFKRVLPSRRRILRAALRCQQRLDEREKKRQAEGKPVFRSRIGLNTGDMIVGNMSSAERLNYSVIGDTVNLASRLMGINKYYSTRSIVGEKTQQLIADQFATRLLDFVAVKGKSEAIRIDELVGEKHTIDDTAQSFIAHYETAMELYRRQQWHEAEREFKAALSLRANAAAKLMLGRISQFRLKSPPPDGNGEYIRESK